MGLMMSDKWIDKIEFWIRSGIAKISFKIFLWSIRMTQEQYWFAIYEQERNEINKIQQN